MGHPPLRRWGTRFDPGFLSPTAKAMGHPTYWSGEGVDGGSNRRPVSSILAPYI